MPTNVRIHLLYLHTIIIINLSSKKSTKNEQTFSKL
jgi:hypothetical protein